MKATAKDLRIHTKRILEAVERGEEVIVTRRNKPCAKLVSLKSEGRASRQPKRQPLFGIWKHYRATRNVASYVDSLRSGRH